MQSKIGSAGYFLVAIDKKVTRSHIPIAILKSKASGCKTTSINQAPSIDCDLRQCQSVKKNFVILAQARIHVRGYVQSFRIDTGLRQYNGLSLN